MEKKFNVNWQLQAAIWADEALGTSEVVVLSALVWRRNAYTGACYPSRQTIAKDTRLSSRQVRRIIKGLEEKGYLSLLKKKSYSYAFPKWTSCPSIGDMVSSKPLREPGIEEKDKERDKEEEKNKKNTWEKILKDEKMGVYATAALRSFDEPELPGDGLLTDRPEPFLGQSVEQGAPQERR